MTISNKNIMKKHLKILNQIVSMKNFLTPSIVYMQYIVEINNILCCSYFFHLKIQHIHSFLLVESVETQYNPECFEMENGKFTFESGTPPDYFNENGQKWNSPPVFPIGILKNESYPLK